MKKFLISVLALLLSVPTLGALGGFFAGFMEKNQDPDKRRLGQLVFFWSAFPLVLLTILAPNLRTMPGDTFSWPFWQGTLGSVLLALVLLPAMYLAAGGRKTFQILIFFAIALFTFGLFGIGYGLAVWRSDRRHGAASILASLALRCAALMYVMLIYAATWIPLGKLFEGVVALAIFTILGALMVWLVIRSIRRPMTVSPITP